jgi:hypothetical protein
MVNVKSKDAFMKIAINDLILIFFGETIAEYCFTHKLENMVNIIHKRCVHENCDKHSSFNHLEKHSLNTVFPINWKNMVNVISKRCIHENCNKRPTFNNFGKTTAEYCFSHKLENMVDVINKKCIHENCNKQPAFNNYGETIAEYCFIHTGKY